MPILMDDVMCSRTEKSLDQCNFKPKSNCVHSEDVIVTCSSDANFTQDFLIQRNGEKIGWRLSNPLNITVNGVFVGVGGRVEYYKNKTWNQFCGKGFSI